ncbi:uncharacterized protein [Periplaneta americana]|uniref:uncharacterized protein n=1 Tax=Periplaneta americana TaxID=6978 RepID=UPI0037E77CED
MTAGSPSSSRRNDGSSLTPRNDQSSSSRRDEDIVIIRLLREQGSSSSSSSSRDDDRKQPRFFSPEIESTFFTNTVLERRVRPPGYRDNIYPDDRDYIDTGLGPQWPAPTLEGLVVFLDNREH